MHKTKTNYMNTILYFIYYEVGLFAVKS